MLLQLEREEEQPELKPYFVMAISHISQSELPPRYSIPIWDVLTVILLDGPQRLSKPDLLSRFKVKGEVFWCLEDENDGGAQVELA